MLIFIKKKYILQNVSTWTRKVIFEQKIYLKQTSQRDQWEMFSLDIPDRQQQYPGSDDEVKLFVVELFPAVMSLTLSPGVVWPMLTPNFSVAAVDILLDCGGLPDRLTCSPLDIASSKSEQATSMLA